MAKRLITHQTKLKQQRLLIFFLVSSYTLLCTTLSVTYFFIDQTTTNLETILLLLLIGLTFVLIWARQAMFPIQMYLHYYRMIDEQQPPFKIQSPLGSDLFLNNLKKYQFESIHDTNEFQIFARYYDRLPWVVRTQASLVYIVVVKNQNLTITDKQLDAAIQEHKQTLKANKEIQNELTLLFYRTPKLTEELKEKTQQIINFSLQNRAIITIPCLQIGDDKVYALRPHRLFPNKFYYVLIKLLYYLTDANEML